MLYGSVLFLQMGWLGCFEKSQLKQKAFIKIDMAGVPISSYTERVIKIFLHHTCLSRWINLDNSLVIMINESVCLPANASSTLSVAHS